MKHQKNDFQQTLKVKDHIKELAKRLVLVLFVLISSSFLAYFFYDSVLNFLRQPIGEELYYTSPAGSFNLIIKVCLMVGFIITTPFLIYQLLMFVKPAFNKYFSTKKILLTTVAASVLAILGAAFAYFLILPGTLAFLSSFRTEGLSALISANDYLKFITNIMILFAIMFQLPLIISMIDNIQKLSVKKLFSIQKWVIVVSMVVAIIAPFNYDVITTSMVIVPIIALYNLSIITIIIKHQLDKISRFEIQARISIPEKVDTDLSITVNQSILDFISDDLNKISSKSIRPNVSLGDLYIDLKPAKSQPEKITPADWFIEKQELRQKLSKPRKILSDINQPRINRASA